jgi:hypothetical protein
LSFIEEDNLYLSMFNNEGVSSLVPLPLFFVCSECVFFLSPGLESLEVVMRGDVSLELKKKNEIKKGNEFQE